MGRLSQNEKNYLSKLGILSYMEGLEDSVKDIRSAYSDMGFDEQHLEKIQDGLRTCRDDMRKLLKDINGE